MASDKTLRRSMARTLRHWGAKVSEAGSIAEATGLLDKNPDLLITDVALPDGDAFALLGLASRQRPMPVAIAVGHQTSIEDAFRLAQVGFHAYLEKPLDLERLVERIERALSEASKLDALVAASVGRTPTRELQAEVRRMMVEQTLANGERSGSAAARLLSVSRQAVQQMVRQHEEGLGLAGWASKEPATATQVSGSSLAAQQGVVRVFVRGGSVQQKRSIAQATERLAKAVGLFPSRSENVE